MTYPTSRGALFFTGATLPDPLLADDDQLKVRFDATTNSYEIQLPNSQSWSSISLPAGTVATSGTYWETADKTASISATDGAYVSLLRWSAPNVFGVMALAVPTPTSSMPRSGEATYTGSLAGYTTEKLRGFDGRPRTAAIDGTIQLAFDFATAGLSGSISPSVRGQDGGYFLPALTFVNTIHAVGSTTFSGSFNTNVAGINSFSGAFAGPNAESLGGNFAFPYVSPAGVTQQASGAFTATKP